MHTRSNLHILYTILVLMIAQAHCGQFMCYVCDDCSEVSTNTPKQICDETFFNKESTLPPTVVTDPTTEKVTSTTAEATETTISSEPPQTTNPPPPTPPTIAPVVTTTPLPTPPTSGTVAGPVALTELNETSTVPTSTQTTLTSTADTTLPTTILQPVKLFVDPAEIRMRQLRSISNPEFSYHCYSVKENVTGTLTTSRGCARIVPKEAVCTQWKEANNNTEYSSCYACSNPLCNSSSAAGASIVAMIISLAVAFLFKSTTA